MLKNNTGGDRAGPGPVDPIVVGEAMTGEVEVAKDREGQCAEVREIDAADSFNRKWS